jgi:hypothetical protein
LWAATTSTDLDLEARLKTGQFTALSTVNEMPSGLAQLCAGPHGSIADPRGAFIPTDVVDSRPNLRLVWAVTDRTIYVMHLEIGGIAHSFITVVASSRDSGEPTILWRVWGLRSTFDSFRSGFTLDGGDREQRCR